ncbi:MAG: DEAD/DEAH box helicase family protein [Deltaproteobacteria bacterium]|nr:DEAD/DEAH box helicase family protein [Deltaproteobacteria bacterium]
MTVLLDNKGQGKVGDALAEGIQANAHLSVLSSLFSIYGYSALKKQLARIGVLRLLISSNNASVGSGTEQPFRVAGLSGSEADRRFRNALNLPEMARECAQWLQQKAEIRAVSLPVLQNLFHIENPDGSAIAIHGSSPFTSAGLGTVPSDGYEMNTCFTTPAETQSLLKWFDSIWQNPEATRDVKSHVVAQLETIFASKSPQLVYFLTLYNVFRDYLGKLEEDKIIKTRTGIKDTLVWGKLYRFQRDGVLGAIDKIEKYNGCIIADSVGLGKTFEALAIIKYYELRNDRVLVLCPKKLRENWTLYTVNDRRNLFAADRFNFDVLNHTDLTRVGGKSGEINLETLNWGNYDLVVIDESHNFRNNPPRKDGLTRYSRLMREIIKSGVKTKVLMLSATPVNSRMNDLKNQVAFITEGTDDALYNCGIASIEQTLRKAQTRFNQWLRLDAAERTTEDLLEALNFDYFKLLDLLTIARSRKHIEKYYDFDEVGEFPERARPINIKSDIDTKDLFLELREINRDIRRLNLSSYAPLKYVLPNKLEEYSRKYDMEVSGGSVFKQIDREESLIHLMRVNLLKRMESSINSFALTLARLLEKVRDIISRIDSHDESEIEELSIEEIEIEDDDFAPYLIGSKIKVLLQDVDRVRWRQELEEDEVLLVKLLREAREIDASRDEKLRRFKELIVAKCGSPINSDNKKVLIFTAFADTAQYLYENIAEWAHDALGIHSALVTGGNGGNKTTMPKLRKDIATIITSFSPLSKERAKIDESLTEEIDILISTDCLSEGQNLQDCDCVVNYDIHWNPVRIIQRFGRIDRLGSQNQVIQLVNFWPNMELDEYINLEARVSGRMVLLDISATGEENIIEFPDAGKMNDLEYRRRQLEQLQNEVVDLEDLGGGISITDMTLNDFRMDLAEYLKEHADRLEHMPPGAFAVTRVDDLIEEEGLEPGVIFCLRSESAKVTTDSTYALAPHYLVWVSESGEVQMNFTRAKKILDLLKKLSLGRSQPDEGAVARFNWATHDATDMSKYQALLSKAVAAITGKAEEKGVESLFHRGGTALSKDSFQGMDDFEVVSYLIILGEATET